MSVIGPKIVGRERLRQIAQLAREGGMGVTFTNGCFELFHRGHLDLLEEAAKLGDVLIVGVNSDLSFERYRKRSPWVSDSDRAATVAALECVDFVCVFPEESVLPLVEVVMPDILVKGGDYSSDFEIVGAHLVQSAGGAALRIPAVWDRSSSQLIERIRDSKERD